MATQQYTVSSHPIETLLTRVKSGEIAVPEFQRSFVWEATKVRNLLDSFYRSDFCFEQAQVDAEFNIYFQTL
jgi:uncharacterized protein with ParB-like and HNH nuclease domain